MLDNGDTMGYSLNMKTLTAALLGITLLASSSAQAAKPKTITCYGFEVDAGQLDEVGADQLSYDMAGTGNKLDPRFNADVNVWVCSGDVLGAHPLTSYATYTDSKGRKFAKGTR